VTAVQPKQADRSLGELVGDMTSDLSRLMHDEVELAKEEIRIEADKAKSAVGAFGGAAGAGIYAGIALVIALGFALDTFLWRWLAFLVVALVLGAVAAVLATRGKKQLATVNPTPQQTIETLKEDAQWVTELRN
jgi:MFS family permease